MKEEALKLADELEALHQYVPSEAPEMIRRLVEELDKPVNPFAWVDDCFTFFTNEDYLMLDAELKEGMIPLYTTPQTKTSKCIVKDCENHKHQGGFTGDLCNPCYEFIATGKGVYSQAYRNTQTKPLSDEEITKIAMLKEFWNGTDCPTFDWHDFARAIEERHGIK